MKYIGAHVSVAGGLFNAPKNATKIGATAFAMFTKNQRQWSAKPLTEEDIALFDKAMKEASISKDKVLVHDSYLINLANPDKEKNLKSLNAFLEEMERCEQLGLSLLNFHPGSHLKLISEADSYKLIGENLNKALDQYKNVIPVIETTAGQGTNLGWRFEEIASMIENVDESDRIGVCIDTCHIFGAGYDIRDQESYEKTMAEFDKIIGFDRLKGVHLNDSKKPLASRKDRHAPLGEGDIGITPFELMMKDPRFDNIPLILETPEPEKWSEEIARLKKF